MPNIIEITDLSAPELAPFAQLTGHQLQNRREPEKGVFIAESPKVILQALTAGCQPLALLMERRQIPLQETLLSHCGQTPLYTADREVLAGLTGYTLTRGVLCAMARPPLPTVESVCANARRIVVLEGIVDPTNVGAIFRSAAALGMDGALLTPTCCDPLTRRAARVSMGTVFQIPWTRIGACAQDWPQPGLDRLKAQGFQTAALALREDARPIDDPQIAAIERLALLLGTEGDGLSPKTVAQCDCTLRIPMSHGVDSLNVASAAAVAFWQLRVR